MLAGIPAEPRAESGVLCAATRWHTLVTLDITESIISDCVNCQIHWLYSLRPVMLDAGFGVGLRCCGFLFSHALQSCRSRLQVSDQTRAP